MARSISVVNNALEKFHQDRLASLSASITKPTIQGSVNPFQILCFPPAPTHATSAAKSVRISPTCPSPMRKDICGLFGVSACARNAEHFVLNQNKEERIHIRSISMISSIGMRVIVECDQESR